MALTWLFTSSYRLSNQFNWALYQISDPYSATDATAATTDLCTILIHKSPVLLLRLATRCKVFLVSAILLSISALEDSFESSQKQSHLVAPCLIANVCSAMLMVTHFDAFSTSWRLLNTRTSVLMTSNSTSSPETQMHGISSDTRKLSGAFLLLFF
jgi:hypothetical protein